MTELSSTTWLQLRTDLIQSFPQFYELEPDGPLLMELGADGWLLEVRPEGKVLCQYGVSMDEVMALMSDGTPEDLGTDEVAKQAKYFLAGGLSIQSTSSSVRIRRGDGDNG